MHILTHIIAGPVLAAALGRLPAYLLLLSGARKYQEVNQSYHWGWEIGSNRRKDQQKKVGPKNVTVYVVKTRW